ncbi:MAG: ABC transporter permease [Bacteroidota bacterium]
MWFNYIKIFIRNLGKYRLSNLINIFGLAFGLSCCILCYLHIQYQYDFDGFHDNRDNIYRLVVGEPNTENAWVKGPAPLPQALKENIPGIEAYTRFHKVSNSPKVVVEHGEDSFNEPYFMMADPSFFEIFNFPLVKGDPNTALNDISAIVITESIAKKIFGDEDPIGKELVLKDRALTFQVTGVAKDVPAQSHITFDYLISFDNLDRAYGEGNLESWNRFNWYVYLLLNPNANRAAVGGAVRAFKNRTPEGHERTFERFTIQPLERIHFESNRGNLFPAYDEKYLVIFAAIAIAVILIACINYVNLAITMSIKRVKEIGLRKAVGAGKFQLTFQFIGEAIITAFISLLLAAIILGFTLPLVNYLLDSQMVINLNDYAFLGFLALVIALVGIISGSYLAFYANSFRPAQILKGGIGQSDKGVSLQKGLILVQFCISITLIICSLIISDQMNFIQSKNLGMDKERVVNIPLYSKPGAAKIETLKSALRSSSEVVNVASSSFVPGAANWNQTIWWEGQVEPRSMFVMTVDKDFVSTLGIEMAEGNPDDILNMPENDSRYLINQAALEAIGWEAGLGRQLSPFGEQRKQPLTGVVKDFNFRSLHHQVEPLVIEVTDKRKHNQLSVKISSNNMPETIDMIQGQFKAVIGELPFEFSFMDEEFDRLYKAETKVGKIISYLTVISVVLALVGLYGLISFSIQNKTKEIAIRKVLGISLRSLLYLFSKGYVQLLLIGTIIALPIAWKSMDIWLDNFSYQVTISPIWFVLSFSTIFVAVAVIALTKSFAIEKVNPAQSLKYE